MAGLLTMPPADIQVVLDAIDRLRQEMHGMWSGLDNRLRALEQRAAASEALARDRGERRQTLSLSRRWMIGLGVTMVAAVAEVIHSLALLFGLIR